MAPILNHSEGRYRAVKVNSRRATIVGLLLVASGSAWAQLNPIPKESGFSGFANLGAMYLDVESNMVAGNEIADVGNSVITSLATSPGSNDDVIPMVNFDLRYTFASTRTQLFLGNSLENLLRFDLAAQAGVRQGVSDKSSVSASFVFTSFPAEVWADPYVVNTPRVDTDRKSNGVRLNWQKALDSEFTVQYTYRDIDIDNELSGLTQLRLPPAQASLLRREGDQHAAEVRYAWEFAPKHTLVPAYRFTKFDLDGGAMANDRNALQITYAYSGDTVSLAVNAEFANSSYDSINPIFLTTRDDDSYGVGAQVFWHRPFGAPEGLSLLGTVFASDSDSNINFYDEKIFATGLSVFYRF